MAFGKIEIGEKTFNFRSSAATEMLYKQVFKKDLLKSFMAFSALADTKEATEENIEEINASTQQVLYLGFIMAMQAEMTAKEVKNLTYDDYLEWLDGIEEMPEDLVTTIIHTYTAGKATDVEQKKERA